MTSEKTTGTIVALQLRPTKGQTEEAERLELNSEVGVEGDHGRSKKRQVTLLSEEAWGDACGELEVELSWRTRRANVLVRGIDLGSTIGSEIELGGCRLRIHGETHPCGSMDESAMGLQAALTPHCRGGVYGEVLEGGSIAPGDRVAAV